MQVQLGDGAVPLDDSGMRVLAQRSGVVLVTGAPGTGKSTVALELVADRVDRGMAADQVLVLAPTREAAARLRLAVTRRLGGTSTEPLCRTPASLAFAILRDRAVHGSLPRPSLLSGPEQDAVLRDLLAGHAEARDRGQQAPSWPAGLQAALPTRGFTDQLRDLLMRAVEHGLDPAGLADLGRHHDRPEWVAAAEVLEEYDQVTALQRPGAVDPAWICTTAAEALEDDPDARERWAARLRLVVVDDAQELTASAARLVEVLHHRDLPVVLLGDADVTAHGFRGADPGRFSRLADRLATATGVPLASLSLEQHHRLPVEIETAAGRVRDALGVSGGARHRLAGADRMGGRSEVVVLRSPGQEATFIAGRLLHTHVVGGLSWSQMAVVARGRGDLDRVRRVLVAAGIPVREQAPAGPLSGQPAVRALLLAYAASLRESSGSASLTPEEAVDLLTSCIGRADPVALRRVRHLVRTQERAAGGARPVDVCLAELVDQPGLALLGPTAAPLARVNDVLTAGRRAVAEQDSTAQTVLWALWEATGLAEHWRELALAGGPVGAQADRDLDAVITLFAAAAEWVQRLPGRGPHGFVEHLSQQRVAADALVVRARPEQAVDVLTPQAAAGRQWDVVAVTGVQEGVWPDLRRRDTLLGAQALVSVLHGRPAHGADGVRAGAAEVRAEETRLFYLAVTRARQQLLVTAVSSTDLQPSPFLELLDPVPGPREPVDVPPVLGPRGLVAHLRREVTLRHRRHDAVGRDRAAAQLSRLLVAGVPGAEPESWWPGRDVSADRPLIGDGPTTVSPSQVETFTRCALRWLLTTRGGEPPGAVGAAVGSLVHEVVAASPEASQDELSQALDQRWAELDLPTGWAGQRERVRAEEMLRRYVSYAASALGQGRTVLAVEQAVDLTVGQARIVGRIDRVEQDLDGRVRVVDLKTGATRPPRREMDRHPQLGVYQLAVAESGLGSGDGGAALVQLGRAAGRDPSVQPQRPLSQDAEPTWAHDMVQAAAQGMAGRQFPATTGSWCRTCPVVSSCPAQPQGRSLA